MTKVELRNLAAKLRTIWANPQDNVFIYRAADELEKLTQQVAVPAGFVLVPIEPTLEMMLQMPASSNSREWKEYYAGMLAAAQGAKP